MRIAVATLGCKVNLYESNALTGSLAPDYTIVSFDEIADLYLINTCAVTAKAEHKSRQLIYRARRASPDAKIVAVGCYGDLAAAKLVEIGADLVVGNNGKNNLKDIISEMLPTTGPGSGDVHSRRARGVVKIQDGCDQFCSYCIIPYLRGPLTSRASDEIKGEIASVAASGINEVVLTGIHMGKYGAISPDADNLAALLRMLLDETDIARIRLSSIEPVEVTDELIDVISGSKRIAPHLHIPLQSGADRILSAMNRPYNADQFISIITKARRRLPIDLAITTDIIVGFPGETDTDFTDTLNVASKLRFSKIHIFKYSDRPLVASSLLPDKIDADVKKKRAAELRRLGDKMANQFRLSQIGREMTVIVESSGVGFSYGISGNYLLVSISDTISKGEMVTVTVTGEKDGRLFAELRPALRREASQI